MKISLKKAYHLPIAILAIATITLFGSLVMNTVFFENIHAAGLKSEACGAGATVDIKNCSTTRDLESGNDRASSIGEAIISIFSIVVGAVSVIMIIVGGFRYIVSNGDSNAVQGAKNSILYAIVGLVIVLFAQVIVRFVLTNATNQT